MTVTSRRPASTTERSQPGSGDSALFAAVVEVTAVAEEFGPDGLLLAAGADGHRDDPLPTLNYDQGGFMKAAWALGRCCGDLGAPFPTRPARSGWQLGSGSGDAAQRVLAALIGGADGYRPLDRTPEAWVWTVRSAYDAFTSVDVSGAPRNFIPVGGQHA